jgi:hypothetical protein
MRCLKLMMIMIFITGQHHHLSEQLLALGDRNYISRSLDFRTEGVALCSRGDSDSGGHLPCSDVTCLSCVVNT